MVLSILPARRQVRRGRSVLVLAATVLIVCTTSIGASASPNPDSANAWNIALGYDQTYATGTQTAAFLNSDGQSLSTCGAPLSGPAGRPACNFVNKYAIDGVETIGSATATSNSGGVDHLNLFDESAPEGPSFAQGSFGQVFQVASTGTLDSFSLSLACKVPIGAAAPSISASLFEVDAAQTALTGAIASVPFDFNVCPTTSSFSPSPSVFSWVPFAFNAPVTAGSSYVVLLTGAAIGGNQPTSAPSIPTGLSGTLTVGSPYSGQVTSSGSPAPGYAITAGALPGGLTLDPTTGAVTGIPTAAGAFSVTIEATNTAGSSPQTFSGTVNSAPVTSAPPVQPTLPGAPTSVRVTGEGGTASVTFQPPATAGTAPITGYRVRVTWGGVAQAIEQIGTKSPITVSGLEAGTTYTVIVTTLTGYGSGGTSTAVTGSWTPTGAVVEQGVSRIAGEDRIATSVEVSKQLFPLPGRAKSAVIASSSSFADSIAGSRLASSTSGPLLLTGQAGLDSVVANEISRSVSPGGTIYVLGNDKALSVEVQEALGGLSSEFKVTRLGGTDRFETAIRVADTVKGAASNGVSMPIYLASGTNYPDGVVASSLAAATGGVVLLTEGGVLPVATRTWLQANDPTGARTTAIGGAAAAAYPQAATSVVGADRYETASLVAALYPAARTSGSTMTRTVGVATGENWPDAVVGATAMGLLGGPLLLTAHDVLPSSAVTRIQATTSIDSSWIFGGSTTVSPLVATRVGDLLHRG